MKCEINQRSFARLKTWKFIFCNGNGAPNSWILNGFCSQQNLFIKGAQKYSEQINSFVLFVMYSLWVVKWIFLREYCIGAPLIFLSLVAVHHHLVAYLPPRCNWVGSSVRIFEYIFRWKERYYSRWYYRENKLPISRFTLFFTSHDSAEKFIRIAVDKCC